MKETVIVILGIVTLTLSINIMQFKSQGVWINCGISEISPDFTKEMREACRQARSKYESGINK